MLIANWINEFRRWCLPTDGWIVTTASSSSSLSTRIKLESPSEEDDDDDDDLPLSDRKRGGAEAGESEGRHTSSLTLSHGKHKRLIVLHNMLYVLPPKYRSKMSFKATEFVLPTYTTMAHHPAYRSLTSVERDLLAKQETKVLADWEKKQDSVALPIDSLVIADEAHNLVNAGNLIKLSTQSRVVLAWVCFLSLGPRHKVPAYIPFLLIGQCISCLPSANTQNANDGFV